MTNSSPDALPLQSRFPARALALLALLLASGVLCFWLKAAGQAPWNDAGGYENMLRGFLQTGAVDYMHWSQPTFVGILPLAVPWAHLFGTQTASLQTLGICYTLLLIAGMYVFCLWYVPPIAAAALAAALFCFPDAALLAPAFMTDIPYAAYLVWFLVVHQTLEVRTADADSRPAPALWAAWGLLFLLTSLTRSFTLVLIPVFLAQAALSRAASNSYPHSFARHCFWLSLLLGVACLGIVRAIGVHAFTVSELTVLPDVWRHHDWARLELRTLCLSLLQTALVSLPVLLLLPSRLWRARLAPGEVCFGFVGLALAAYFCHKGLLLAAFALPVPARMVTLLGVAAVCLVPISVVGLARLLRDVPVRASSTTQLLVALAAAHFLVLPIMQHPLLRHVFPAFLALLLLVACAAPAPLLRPRLAVVAAVILTIISVNSFAARNALRLNTAQYNAALRLHQSGEALAGIDGGWSWFCAQDLLPQPAAPQDYVFRYHALQQNARYVVTNHGAPQTNGPVIYDRQTQTLPAEVTSP